MNLHWWCVSDLGFTSANKQLMGCKLCGFMPKQCFWLCSICLVLHGFPCYTHIEVGSVHFW